MASLGISAVSQSLMGGILLLIVASLSLTFYKAVVLKMLPFDNKSEFQVVLDMPEGTSLEQTTRVLDAEDPLDAEILDQLGAVD